MVFRNEMSKKFIMKFLEDTFKDVSSRGWLKTIYFYMISSKYRTTKRLDYFLKVQVNYPHADLVDAAIQLRTQSKSPDDLIINVLKYVNKRVKYVSDQSNFNQIENWAGAYDAWKTREADCDDQNCLIYVLARLAGISDLSLWSAIGTTKARGHYWNVYFSTKTAKWYPIDSTYKVDLRSINTRKQFRFNANDYQSIWFLFNEQAILKPK